MATDVVTPDSVTGSSARDVLVAARLAGIVTGLVTIVGIAVHLTAAEQARASLDFGFAGLEPRLGQAAEIFANNVRLLGAVFVAVLVTQMARPAADAALWERALLRMLVGIGELMLVAGVAFHVAFVGFALGAYGGRTVNGMLPHGPFELAAFSLGLALFLAARRERLAWRRIACLGAASVLALAAAALLEVFA